MTKKLFTSEYQPANKGRKSYPDAVKKIGMTVYVQPDTRVWLKAHKVKGGEILDQYVKFINNKTMTINELQIGDWVLYHGEYRRIQKIDGILGFLDLENERIPVPIDCVAPVLLTPEILEKNGFWWGLTTDQEDMLSLGLGVPISVQKSWVWEDEDGGKVVLDFPNEADGGQAWCHTDKKDSSMVWLDSIYVHELQQALRLCGLNDLADGLKI